MFKQRDVRLMIPGDLSLATSKIMESYYYIQWTGYIRLGRQMQYAQRARELIGMRRAVLSTVDNNKSRRSGW